MATATEDRVTRDDLEHRFTALQRSLQGKLEDRKQSLLAIGAGVGVVVVVIVFLLGKRSGRKKTTLVEIRRL